MKCFWWFHTFSYVMSLKGCFTCSSKYDTDVVLFRLYSQDAQLVVWQLSFIVMIFVHFCPRKPMLSALLMQDFSWMSMFYTFSHAWNDHLEILLLLWSCVYSNVLQQKSFCFLLCGFLQEGYCWESYNRAVLQWCCSPPSMEYLIKLFFFVFNDVF